MADSSPKSYFGVMVSSTFSDLIEHRRALMDALRKEEIFAIGMEDYIPIPQDDVISSSLNMVRKARAYVAVISHRYGQVVFPDSRNPNGYSVTRLEFEEAMRLGLPTLVFSMDDEHPIKRGDVEIDPEKIVKLGEFRVVAKAGRIYSTFSSLEDFRAKAIHCTASLRRYIEEQNIEGARDDTPSTHVVLSHQTGGAPLAPALYAEPPYIGSHQFIGREAQLDVLNEWATPADTHSLLLFEAIGGSGKSILTWEWINRHATKVRSDWAGRFWYSFYEKGATMSGFCRHVLAYMTGKNEIEFKDRSTGDLAKLLLPLLRAKPWLVVLDGVERVLVSYHRYDAPQMKDEHAGTSDRIANRDPCSAINLEDDDLLRRLASANPSKLLLTSRLAPRVLLNKSHQAVPGVIHNRLPGLRPADAEALLRSCGISGNSIDIQSYLKTHCDCHPLVIGVLAGLINDYLPDRGNFDAWQLDSNGGGRLDFSKLDLVQKRNHILDSAIQALSSAGRDLLSTIALLPDSVDYVTLSALSPYSMPAPKPVETPQNPRYLDEWQSASSERRKVLLWEYQIAREERQQYLVAIEAREEMGRLPEGTFRETVADLERRGLLQYDHATKRYDLHPVVRGISADRLNVEEKDQYGRVLVDYFSKRADDPYDEVESIDGFEKPRHIVKVLLMMDRRAEALHFLNHSTFIQALNNRFEAHNEILEILQPFFPSGWAEIPQDLRKKGGLPLAKRAAIALRRIGALEDACNLSEAAIRVAIARNNEQGLCTQLIAFSSSLGAINRLADESRILELAEEVAKCSWQVSDLVSFELAQVRQLATLGAWDKAELLWYRLAPTVPPDSIHIASHHRALHHYLRGDLSEEVLQFAETQARENRSALGIRNLHALRGTWRLEAGDYVQARTHLSEAVRLAQEIGKLDRRSEVKLAIAEFHLGELADGEATAHRLSYGADPNALEGLAKLWLLFGDKKRATSLCLDAYRWAYADGHPYTRCKDVEQAIAIFKELDIEIPAMPKFDPEKCQAFPWESSARGLAKAKAAERAIRDAEGKR